MSSLARTIDVALIKIGHGPRDLLLETLSSFGNLSLSDEERVSAVATAIGAGAVLYHSRHIGKFLDAVRIWALETAEERARALPRIRRHPDEGAIGEAADMLVENLQTLLDSLNSASVPLEDRVVVELTLYTRLLGQHDANTILLAIGAVADAVRHIGYRAGDLIAVELRDAAPFARDADLAQVVARGVA